MLYVMYICQCMYIMYISVYFSFVTNIKITTKK